MSVGGKADNTRGTISAAGALNANVAGAVNNNAGALIANQRLALGAGALDNTKGSIQSSLGATQLAVTGALTNTGGTIGAATDLVIRAGGLSNTGAMRGTNNATVDVGGTLTNDGSITAGQNTTVAAGSLQGTKGVLGAGVQNDGTLGTAGDLTVTTTQGLTATGTNIAAGNMTLQGASVDLAGSQTSAAAIAITATQGNVTTSKATVATPGTLRITANAQAGQTLVNDDGTINAGRLDLRASNIANTNAGEIVQTGTAATAIVVSGALNNAGGRIAVNSDDLTLQAATIANTGGKIEHAGGGTLGIRANSFDGANGEITGNGALVVMVACNVKQVGGSTSAKRVAIDAGALSNRGGAIVQTGTDAARITVVGALDNRGGTIASNGAANIAAGSAINQAGSIRSAGTSDLTLTVAGALDNSGKGEIGAGANATVNAGSLNNDTGRITAVGDLAGTVAGAATTIGGTLAANGNTTVKAAGLNNNYGTVAAVNGNLSVTTSGTTNNVGGTMQASGATTLSNGGLDNRSGKVFGDSVNVDTHGQQLSNGQGTIAATKAVDLQTGALVNDAGLIQSGAGLTIDTHGQALSNANAAGYAGGQGGITSAGTLTLNAGATNNTAGFIGAKGALTASTQAFSNTGNGLVVGQDTVSVNTNGAAYDNTGGQTMAVNDLTVNAGSITNSGGLLRSGGTTTLRAGSVVNANTLGTNQGIEGRNVAITVGKLSNTAGAIRSDVDTTITSGGSVDNTNGLISAGDTLKIVDPNAASPSAKTLSVVNTGGTLVANSGLVIDAATFSGDGTVASGKNLAIALTQDLVNNGEVKATGNLSYGTTGNLSNNGKLLAGNALTVSGNSVTNAANAEMSGGDTTVNAGTLTNRGLIDSSGDTRINAGVLNNLGTGRIYGDQVAIGAGALNNDAETVNGITTAATIAGRYTVDIGAGGILNRDHALIFSGGDMFIGGALDAYGYATGQGSALDNHSASIESLGSMFISMGQVDNRDIHLQVGKVSSTSSATTIVTLDGKSWNLADTWGDPATRLVYHRDTDGSVGVVGKGWSYVSEAVATNRDVATRQDPARIVAGGDMSIQGALNNRDSRVMAGGSLGASSVDNSATTGQLMTTTTDLIIGYNPNRPGKAPELPIVLGPTVNSQTVAVGESVYMAYANGVQGYAVSNRSGVGGVATAGNPGQVGNQGRTPTIVEVPSAVGAGNATGGNTASAANGASGSGSATAASGSPLVVRTTTPTISIPQASLFHTVAGGRYLVETDARFANYRNWLSSDYLLDRLGLDPNNTLKRLGDGFYEQRLVREQVAQLTGYRYLDGFDSDEAQYTALMNSGALFAQQHRLRPGIALTPEQMAQLTSDIVWLVEQTVTLPDGSTQTVLVPQVYVRVTPGDIDGSGALLSASRLRIDTKGDVTNDGGTIAGRELVTINADTINNLTGGRISGGSVGLAATQDINNLGASIDAANSLRLDAGRDINVRTTVANGPIGNVNVDRVAGLYVSNPNGLLVANAGNNLDLVGAQVRNEGANSTTLVRAGNDINLATVQTSAYKAGASSQASITLMSAQEVGTTIKGGGDVMAVAGRDINARAATVGAGGDLTALAGRDVRIEAGRNQSGVAYSAAWTDKDILTRTSNTFDAQATSNKAQASNFSAGGNMAVAAGRDVNVIGSDLQAGGNASLNAGRNVNVVSAEENSNVIADRTRTTKGVILPTPGNDHNIDSRRSNSDHAELSTETERASNVAAGGNLTVLAGNQVNIYASNLTAGQTLGITGQEVNVYSGAERTRTSQGSSSDRDTLLVTGTPTRSGTGMNARADVTNTMTATTLAPATLSGNRVDITATDGDITLTGARINAAQRADLNAVNGAVNFGVVSTGTEVSQSRGQDDLAYQRTRDSGVNSEAANYTQIDSPNLAINTPQVNVQAGQNVAYQGANAQYGIPLQTVAQAIAAQATQPGMQWLTQVQNSAQLNNLQLNWQGVPLEQRQWAQAQSGLTPAGAAIVTIVASALTWGAAGVAGGAVAGGVGATGATATVISVAVQAGIANLAGQASVSLINNNGDIGAVLDELGSSQSVRSILTAMVTAGVNQGLNIGLNMQSYTGVNAAAGSATWGQVLGRNVLDSVAAGLVYSAINGTSAEDAIRNGLLNGLLSTGAAASAQWIGGNTQGFANAFAHAVAGCLAGAGRASVGGGGVSAGDGCSAGAIGATVGHFASDFYNPTGNPELAQQTIQFGQLLAGIAGALAGGNQVSADIAAAAGVNAVVNNSLLHPQTSLEIGIRQAILRGDVNELRLLLGETTLSAADALAAQRIVAAMEAMGPQNAKMLAERYGADWINKISHIFEGAHQGPVGNALLQQFGSPAVAFVQVQNAVDALGLTVAGQSTTVRVVVQGISVQVRVIVLDGVARISTILKM